MAPTRTASNLARLVRAATSFDPIGGDDDGDVEQIVVDVPDDLSTLDDAALAETIETATEAFQAIAPADGDTVTAEDLDAMEALASTIEALHAEQQTRSAAARERAEQAAAISARIAGDDSGDDGAADDDGDEGDPVAEAEQDDEAADEDEEDGDPVAEAEQIARDSAEREQVAASARSLSISVERPRRRRRQPEPARGLVFRGSGGGSSDGRVLDDGELARVLSRRADAVSVASIEAALARGQSFSSRNGVAMLRREDQPGYDPRLVIDNEAEADAAIRHAVDQSRLPGGSLTAAGWCSPSEVMYDLFDGGLAPGAGVLSIPEVTFARGGMIFTPGIGFGAVEAVDGFFAATATEAAAGDYGSPKGTPPSDKPAYVIDCGTPQDVRLALLGMQFQGDILARRADPERIAEFLRVALAVHQRRLSTSRIASMVAGSTTVTQPASQVGAAAPALGFFELQVEYLRNRANLVETATIEAVLPHWARGAFRADLARRVGVDLIDVSNARLDAHLAQRGVAAQYVYGWQGLDAAVAEGGAAGAAPTQWPTALTALLYPAGTWVAGTSDVIELDTIHDSTLLAQNRYTALFVEEGWAVMNRGPAGNSLELTMNVEVDGATAAGVNIDHDGSIGA